VASFYLDTSALAKRYATERGSTWISHLVEPASGHHLWTVRLTGPELIAALSRKARAGDVSVVDAARAAHDFRVDWQRHYQIIEVTVAVADQAMMLAERYGLRGYDAVHLAAALAVSQAYRLAQLPPPVLLSADADQLRVAQLEGLAVDDPNNHP
jgi:predicted nucleic acid-binding protein